MRQKAEDGIGVRAAAIRKLPHELGIPSAQLNAEDFTFLTRIHYLAPSDGLWGEHESELFGLRSTSSRLTCRLTTLVVDSWCSSLTGLSPVDYILFCSLDVDLEINPNEVSDAKYVSKPELEAMFADSCAYVPVYKFI